MKQERVALSQKEIKRIKVMGLLAGGKMTNQEAAESLSLCRRQIIRLRKKYTAQGEMGLIHGNRDRRPQHRTGNQIYSAPPQRIPDCLPAFRRRIAKRK